MPETSGAPRPDPSLPVNAIEALDVVKTYHSDGSQVHALRGITFRVAPGEIVAVMGPSGCGKTTLLNCLSGLDRIDSGVIRIGGTDLSSLDDDARTRHRARRMGFVFQLFNLLPVLSAVENAELPLLVTGMKAAEARRRALDALARVGLEDAAPRRPAQLSGGERQRVAVARALVNQPDIVWADEPTGNLDSQTAAEVMNLIVALNRSEKATFVVVTHDPGIGARCDRIVHMRDGQIVEEETPVAGTAR